VKSEKEIDELTPLALLIVSLNGSKIDTFLYDKYDSTIITTNEDFKKFIEVKI
jgi:hypothetical protein